MARVPQAISSAFLGSRLEDDGLPQGALRKLSDREVGRLIKQCSAALRGHSGDFHAGREKEDALAAFESAMALLLELRDIHSSRKAEIDAILDEFGYPVPSKDSSGD